MGNNLSLDPDPEQEYTRRHRAMVRTSAFLDADDIDDIQSDAVSATIEDGVAFDSSSESDYSAEDSSDESSDNYDREEDLSYTFRSIERNIFIVREFNGTRPLGVSYVIAPEPEPLVQFCYMMQANEDQLAAETGDWDRVGDEYTNVPGVVTTFVEQVMGGGVQEHVTVKVHAHGEIAEPRDPEFEEVVIDGVILNPSDREYDHKKFALMDILSRGTRKPYTPSFKQDHLRRFNHVGITMGAMEFRNTQERDQGETNISPVRRSEPWYVINLPYYYLYRSYRLMCDRNSRTLYALARSLPSQAQGGKFVLGTSTAYSAAQEHAVLARLLKVEHGAETDRESVRMALHDLQECADSLCGKIESVQNVEQEYVDDVRSLCERVRRNGQILKESELIELLRHAQMPKETAN